MNGTELIQTFRTIDDNFNNISDESLLARINSAYQRFCASRDWKFLLNTSTHTPTSKGVIEDFTGNVERIKKVSISSFQLEYTQVPYDNFEENSQYGQQVYAVRYDKVPVETPVRTYTYLSDLDTIVSETLPTTGGAGWKISLSPDITENQIVVGDTITNNSEGESPARIVQAESIPNRVVEWTSDSYKATFNRYLGNVKSNSYFPDATASASSFADSELTFEYQGITYQLGGIIITTQFTAGEKVCLLKITKKSENIGGRVDFPSSAISELANLIKISIVSTITGEIVIPIDQTFSPTVNYFNTSYYLGNSGFRTNTITSSYLSGLLTLFNSAVSPLEVTVKIEKLNLPLSFIHIPKTQTDSPFTVGEALYKRVDTTKTEQERKPYIYLGQAYNGNKVQVSYYKQPADLTLETSPVFDVQNEILAYIVKEEMSAIVSGERSRDYSNFWGKKVREANRAILKSYQM